VIAVVDPFTGLAGDMFLGALLDAGAPLATVQKAVGSTGLTGWSLSAEAVDEHGLRATRVSVSVSDTATERHASELIALASRARPEPVAAAAVRVVRAVAETEARLHGVDPDEVHLHELGGHDTIVDVVGVCAALYALDVTTLYCGALPLGRGTVTTRHGVLPMPAPATAQLLRDAVVVGSDLPGETVTPTAAGLLAALGTRWDAPPPYTLRAIGYGAGTRSLPDRPNVAAVRLGSAAETADEQVLDELATTLDDVTGETIGYVIEQALAAGARDVWVTPAVMKKSRPAHVLHVLCEPADTARLRGLLFRETGTLGVRSYAVRRHAATRDERTVEVEGRPVRVKLGPYGVKAEHDDVAAAARALNRPRRDIAREAESIVEQEAARARR
jgi:pyridinium-3,5-bisthiocarboxylic acid mononucleotide nickel chelatase